MKTDYPIIDGHGHMLPDPSQIPESIKKAGYFDIKIDGNRQSMTQKFINWTRPVSHPTFFLKPRLEWMDQHKISHTVLLTLSQLYCNGMKKQAVVDIMRFQNDYQLQLQTQYPKKFSCGFVVQPRFLDISLREIEQRAKEGLKFLCLSTHYKNAKGKWLATADDSCREIFELANQLGLPIQIHPYDYEEIMNLGDINDYWLGHIVAMPALTACFYLIFVYKRMYERYPNVRFYLAHGNTLGMTTVGRAVQGFKGRPDYYSADCKSPGYALQAKNVFCDSIVHDWDVIDLLKKKIGASQIIHGIDSPYPLGDGVDYVDEKVYPGFILDNAEDCKYIDAGEKYQILRENVITWLYDKDTAKAADFKTLIGF